MFDVCTGTGTACSFKKRTFLPLFPTPPCCDHHTPATSGSTPTTSIGAPCRHALMTPILSVSGRRTTRPSIFFINPGSRRWSRWRAEAAPLSSIKRTWTTGSGNRGRRSALFALARCGSHRCGIPAQAISSLIPVWSLAPGFILPPVSVWRGWSRCWPRDPSTVLSIWVPVAVSWPSPGANWGSDRFLPAISIRWPVRWPRPTPSAIRLPWMWPRSISLPPFPRGAAGFSWLISTWNCCCTSAPYRHSGGTTSLSWPVSGPPKKRNCWPPCLLSGYGSCGVSSGIPGAAGYYAVKAPARGKRIRAHSDGVLPSGLKAGGDVVAVKRRYRPCGMREPGLATPGALIGVRHDALLLPTGASPIPVNRPQKTKGG